MGKIEFFKIFFQKQNPIYFPGEQLKGEIKIRILERFKIRCIKMMIKGDAHVSWFERENRRTYAYYNNENYLNFKCIFISKESQGEFYLETGLYSLPFYINLPSNLPTSFEHELANVRYSVICTIDIPWKSDKHSVRTFTVISPLDLNYNFKLREPYETTDSKVLCCGPFKSDPITISFSIPKGKNIIFWV